MLTPAPISAFITATGTLAAGIAAVTLGVGFLTPALAALGITVTAAFGPIAIAVGAVAALTGGIIAMTNAVNAADVEKAGKAFGDIATEAGLAGEEMATFAQRASDAEKFLKSMALDGMVSGKAFERLAKDLGLTNDQLAQIAMRSSRASLEVKEVARKYLDGASAAKRFAEANMALGLTLRDSWRTKTPEEIKKVEDALKNLSTQAEVVAETQAFSTSELEEFANRYKTVAASVADIVGFMRSDQAKAEVERPAEIEATNQPIVDAYAYSQAKVRDIIEARMHGITAENEKENQKQLDANIKLADSILNTFSGLATALGDIFAGIYQRQIDEAERAYDLEREKIENNGLTRKEALEKNRDEAIATGDEVKIADAQRALDLYNLEADFTRKKAQLEYEAAMTQWKFNLAIAAANSANAILKAVGSAAFPLNLPAIGFASVLGVAQTAAVAAAQPQPPAFATGGIVLPSGSSGKQVTVADKGGGEIMFGTGAMGAPMMQAFIGAVADEVVNRMGGGKITIPLYLDSKIVATSTAKLIDDGIVPMRSLTR